MKCSQLSKTSSYFEQILTILPQRCWLGELRKQCTSHTKTLDMIHAPENMPCLIPTAVNSMRASKVENAGTNLRS